MLFFYLNKEGKKGEVMHLRILTVLVVLLMACQLQAGEKTSLKTDKEKASYSIGMDIGNNIKRQSIEIDPDALAQGLRDAYSGKKTLLTEQEAREILQAFQKAHFEKQQEERKKLGEKNLAEGKAFLEKNKSAKGVITLEDGLQYRIIKEGTGKKPKATDKVTVNYTGTLIDGTEFDSSYKRGKPATFPVNGVIKGWTEALQLMKEGAVWELFIPSDLAYGERGAGNDIGPNAVLIFQIELISVQ